jgi:hypothetical protein
LNVWSGALLSKFSQFFNCCGQLHTTAQILDHLANEAIPALIDWLAAGTNGR